MKSSLALLTVMVASATAGSVSLTGANYDEEVTNSGKAAFIKFQAPWWGHCKSMKPAWEQLGDEFSGSKTVIIGDVDCTVEKDLCGKIGVKGYPTIKYFTGATAAEGDKYEGGRDFDALKAFAEESLGPSCGADNLDLCNDEQKETIATITALGAEGIEAFITEKTGEVEAAEKYVKDEIQKLQDRYQELQTEKDDKVKELGKDLGLYRSVKAQKAAPAKEEL